MKSENNSFSTFEMKNKSTKKDNGKIKIIFYAKKLTV